MGDKRQKNQLELAFPEMSRSEAPRAPRKGSNRPRRSANPKARREVNV